MSIHIYKLTHLEMVEFNLDFNHLYSTDAAVVTKTLGLIVSPKIDKRYQ